MSDIKVLVSYADSKMAYSQKRLCRQARHLSLFDEVISYSPDSLPDYILQSPLMQHSYGGGYWAWKPCIIWETLQKYEEGTAVCYVDAGCTLNKNLEEWGKYFDVLKETDTLLFKYPDSMPMWEHYGTTSTKIKHWAKKRAVDYYDMMTGGQKWREQNKILGGFIFAKGKNNPIIKDWLDIVLNHPEVIDDSGVFDEQNPFFVRHKHDQPALTALAYKYSSSCVVLPELLDEGPADAAVVAERVRVKNFWQYLVWCGKKAAKHILGKDFVAATETMFRKR